MSAELEARANDYDRDAATTANGTPDELRELAVDARAQVQRFRNDTPAERQDAAQSTNGTLADSTTLGDRSSRVRGTGRPQGRP
ncbi:hypothetical protein [Rathayibacter tritici]|uniref:Uncharacterized protein n=1 Tax=Rathayibacter tritici TaxID=33888 RepID=A0A160KVP8_9MICO|nr:hypothetical protein [Rathayibacter tritici]AND17817.1 hypothetical protein A6122_2705 [Rathayibacter tritici]PPF24648.1 hypothetical protein C5C06_12865 [Rathayibacter tritici]PPI17655.1 hypothetical protein C5D07_04555 [Rathayibacter tritici]PPI47068.1 hypothetical protein C5D18_04550 [Rathayibacter tritici]